MFPSSSSSSSSQTTRLFVDPRGSGHTFFQSARDEWQAFLEACQCVKENKAEQLAQLFERLNQMQLAPQKRLVARQDLELFRLAFGEEDSTNALRVFLPYMTPTDIAQITTAILETISEENLTRAILTNASLIFSYLAAQRANLGDLLFLCIRKNHLLPVLNALLTHIPNIRNLRLDFFPLVLAIQSDNVDALRLLLHAGVQDPKQAQVDTLAEAIASDRVEMVEILLQYMASNTRNSLHRRIPEALALAGGDELERALSSGMNIEAVKNKASQRMLRYLFDAIVADEQQGDDEVYSKFFFWVSLYCDIDYIVRVDWLRQRLARLSHPTCSTLFIASINTRCLALARLLVDLNPFLDLHFQSDKALEAAVMTGQEDMADFLLSQNTPPIEKERKFLLACQHASLSMMQIFFRHNTDIHTAQAGRGAALPLVCEGKSSDTLEKLQFLLDQDADVRVENNRALYEACQTGNLPVAELLVQRGADIDQILHTGVMHTPLVVSILNGFPKIVRLLFAHNVNPEPFLVLKDHLLIILLNRSWKDEYQSKWEDYLSTLNLLLRQNDPNGRRLVIVNDLERLVAHHLTGMGNQLFSFLIYCYPPHMRASRSRQWIPFCTHANYFPGLRFISSLQSNPNVQPNPNVYRNDQMYMNSIAQAMQILINRVTNNLPVNPSILIYLYEEGADIHVNNDRLIKMAAARQNHKRIIKFLLEYAPVFTPQALQPIVEAFPNIVEVYASEFPAYHAGRWQKTMIKVQKQGVLNKLFFAGRGLWVQTTAQVEFVSSLSSFSSLDANSATLNVLTSQPIDAMMRRPVLCSNIFGVETNIEDAIGVGNSHIALLLRQRSNAAPLGFPTAKRSRSGGASGMASRAAAAAEAATIAYNEMDRGPEIARMVVLLKINSNNTLDLSSLSVLRDLPLFRWPCARLACAGEWLAVAFDGLPENFPVNPFAIVNAAAINDGLPAAVIWDADKHNPARHQSVRPPWKKTAIMLTLPDQIVKTPNKFAFFLLNNLPTAAAAHQRLCLETNLPYSVSLYLDETDNTNNTKSATIDMIPNAVQYSAIPSNARDFGRAVFVPENRQYWEDGIHGSLYTYVDDAMEEGFDTYRIKLLSEREEENAYKTSNVLKQTLATQQRAVLDQAVQTLWLQRDKDQIVARLRMFQGRARLKALFPQPFANWSRGAMRVYHGWRYTILRSPWTLSLEDASIQLFRMNNAPAPEAVVPTQFPPFPETDLPELRNAIQQDIARAMLLQNQMNE